MDVEEQTERLKADREHGASELALWAVEIMKNFVCSGDFRDATALIAEMKSIAQQIKTSRPSMAAPLGNTVDEFLGRAEEIALSGGGIAEAIQKCSIAADSLIEKLKKLPLMVARNFGSVLGEKTTVMTHSYSSTCLKTFSMHAKMIDKIFVCESRPGFEGRQTAEKLKDAGLKVVLITDAEAGFFIKEVDMVVVGADCVLENGDVINKMGTYLLALAAKDCGKKFYVLCDRYKFLKAEENFGFEEKVPQEIWQAPPGIIVRNIYFDSTPAPLITKIITEKSD